MKILAGVLLGFALGVASVVIFSPTPPVQVLNASGSTITLHPGSEVTITVRRGAAVGRRKSEEREQEL